MKYARYLSCLPKGDLSYLASITFNLFGYDDRSRDLSAAFLSHGATPQQLRRIYASRPIVVVQARRAFKPTTRTNTRKLSPPQYRMRRIRRVKRRICRLHFQSQLGDNHKLFQSASERREERDRIQRKAAKAAIRALDKDLTKAERKAAVLAERDKRNPAFQGGAGIGALIGATTSALGLLMLRGVTKKINNNVDDVGNFINEIRRFVDGAKSTFKKYLGNALWFIPLVLSLWYFLKRRKQRNDFVDAGVKAYVAKTVGPQLWVRVSNFFPDGGERDPQTNPSVEMQSGLAAGAAELLTVLTVFSVFNKKGLGAKEVTEFTKRISVFDRAKQGFESFIDWTMRSLQSLVNAIRSVFGKERVQLFRDSRKPALDWMREVDVAYTQHNTATASASAEELNKLVRLVVDGNGFKELYRGTPMARQVDESLARVVNLLNPHLGALNARNNFRQEPISVMLVGAPGIGKTVISTAACITILLKSGLLKEANFDRVAENIWQKGTSEFWNSYSNQMVVVMDDAFQQRVDKTNADNDFMNMIRMVSSWSMPLNMADLASKGKIFFGSKVIFGTTNLVSIASEARIVLQEPEAVARRITHGYRLHLLPKYATEQGYLNKDLFNAEEAYCAEHGVDVGRFPWHMWEVSKHDFMTGRSDSQRMPLLDLVMKVASDLRARSTDFTSSERAMRSYAEGLASPSPSGNSVTPQAPSAAVLATDDEDMSTEFSFQGGLLRLPFKRAPPAPNQAQPAFLEDFDDFMSSAEEVDRWWRSWLTGAAVLAATGVGLYVGFKLVSTALKGMWSALSSIFNGGDKDSDHKKPVEQSNHPLGPRMKISERKAMLQSADNAVRNNIYANSYKLYSFTDGLLVGVIGQVQFLRADVAVMPAHFSRDIAAAIADGRYNGTTVLTLRNCANYQHSVNISPAAFLKLQRVTRADRDQEFVKFEDIRAHRDIVANFIRDVDFKYLGNQKAILDVCNINLSVEADAVTGKPNVLERRAWAIQHMRTGNNLVCPGATITKYCQYDAGTVGGDCGAPLCLYDNSRFSGRTAIGLHIAGARKSAIGYSNVITQEDILSALADLGGAIEDRFEQDLDDRGIGYQSGDVLPFPDAGSFLALGAVSVPVNLCPKSKYYKVEHMFGRFGEYTDRPAILSPVLRDGELVYPMANAVAPYSSPLLIYEQGWLSQAVYLAFDKLDKATVGSSRAIYTFAEAVQGITQEKFRAIPRGTSAGYPYVLQHKDGKTAFFGKDDINKIDTPLALELEARVERVCESARRGVRLAHVFQDFLKDELRSAAKVEAVATRLISAAPLDYTVAVRRYFGAFTAALMKNTIVTGMAPGICAYSDWIQLAIHLQRKGVHVFDGDLKAFDSKEQPAILRRILKLINAWYNDGEDNARVREVLWLDLMHSRHIGGLGKDQCHVYQWNKSLPSGHPLTTIVNSLYCLVLLIGSYISCTGDLTGFWDHVSPITYGDDNVSNVSHAMCPLFNQVTVARAMLSEFGMTYTPGRKDGVWNPVTTLCDVTFLKRSFRIDSGSWVAPLELSSFLYTPYWCKRPLDERGILRGMLELALEELSLHADDLWVKYSGLIIQAMADLDHRPRVLPEKKEYLRLVQSRTDNYY